jgi:hypothetical protein
MTPMTEEQLETIAKVLFDVAYNAWVMNLKLYNTDVFNDLHEPQVNDYVIETTNPFVPRLTAIGKLVEVIQQEGGWTIYKIERLDGKIHQWENASFVKVADEKTLKLIRS